MIEQFEGHRVIPVLAWDEPRSAELIAEALLEADLPIVEVTFRSPRAAELLGALSRFPELIVGAGTITRAEQVDQAAERGARFLVSPGTSSQVIHRARDMELPILPGVATASDIMAARGAGLTLMKFFPAELLGGLRMLAAYAQVFPDVSFIPTGGINPANLDDYLAAPFVAAVGGTWLFDRDALTAGDAPALTASIRAGRRRP